MLKDKILTEPPISPVKFKELYGQDAYLIFDDYINTIEENIAKLESSAVKVYGVQLKESNLSDQHGPGWFFEESTRMTKGATHQALLIAIEPIEKAVSKLEVVNALRSAAKGPSTVKTEHLNNLFSLSDLADRIEKHGIGE